MKISGDERSVFPDSLGLRRNEVKPRWVIRDAKQRLVAAVFQWFPFDREETFDKVAVVFSEDEGQTWSKPEPMRVAGLSPSMMRPFDPTVEPIPRTAQRDTFVAAAHSPEV